MVKCCSLDPRQVLLPNALHGEVTTRASVESRYPDLMTTGCILLSTGDLMQLGIRLAIYIY